MFSFTFYGDGYGWSYSVEEDDYVNYGYAVINGEWVYGVLTRSYFQPKHSSCIDGLLNNGEIVTVSDIIYSPFFA